MKLNKKILPALLGTTMMVASFLQVLPASHASAVQITNRSLTLEAGTADSDSDGVDDGGSMPGATVKHLFKFDLQSNASVGSLIFQYCTTAAPVSGGIGCIAPAGMSANGATLTLAQQGVTPDATWTGMQKVSDDDTTGGGSPDGIINEVMLERTSAALINTGTTMTIELTGIVNPSALGTFFVRISAVSGTDGTGSASDTGTVAASTTNQVKVSGTMPESLVFCTGDNIGLTNSVPDCTTATNNLITFNSLFSPTATSFATSQMAASTNAGSGYAITVNGPTLTSGSNTIAPIYTGSSPHSDKSKFGVSQFGLNLVQNQATDYTNAPDIITFNTSWGSEPASATINPASGTGNYHGEPVPAGGYDVAGNFQFNSGDVIADSGSGYTLNAPGGTDAQIYTVSYIVNVPGSQPAGTYATTLTYICTPTF